jgi:hypothetical protein
VLVTRFQKMRLRPAADSDCCRTGPPRARAGLAVFFSSRAALTDPSRATDQTWMAVEGVPIDNSGPACRPGAAFRATKLLSMITFPSEVGMAPLVEPFVLIHLRREGG